jgi:hypothetical protein
MIPASSGGFPNPSNGWSSSPKGFQANGSDLFPDLFFFDSDGADDGAESGFWMSLDANRCRRCS